DSNFDRIAEETNCYARQAMVTKPDIAWCEIDTEKVKAFFALNILFGIKQLPEVHLYWSKNQLLRVPEICFEIKFMLMEIDKVSPVQLPLRLKESSDFVKESRCFFSDPVGNDTVMKTYNNNMGSVDLNDQTWGYYMAGRKLKKWWRCLTWFFVDVAILLIGNFLAQRLSASSGHLEGGHWPIKFSKGHCKRCLKRNKEMWCRMACELCANAFV
ncbi:hypothetical protein pdam_00024723, partial [Pocillopora damicornis]